MDNRTIGWLIAEILFGVMIVVAAVSFGIAGVHIIVTVAHNIIEGFNRG